MKTLMIAFATLCLTATAFSASAADLHAPIQDTDATFVNLDIAKVVADTDASKFCGVRPARLDYLDHNGREHVLNYQELGDGCGNN